MVHEDRQPKADTRVSNCWLMMLAVLLTGAADAAAQESGAPGVAVHVDPVWTHAAAPSAPALNAPAPTASAWPPTPGGWPRLRMLAFSGTLVGLVDSEGAAERTFPSWPDDAPLLVDRTPAKAGETPSTAGLRFFEALPPGDVHAALRVVRPSPIPGDERTRLLSMLPEDSELKLDPAEQRKLAALAPVLECHDRHGVLGVKVIDLPWAGLVIYERTALLVSRPALRLLSASELQAAIAHEIAHEYFWSEYGDSRTAPSAATRHAVELKCDGIAALTLLALGLDVSRLTSAMKKIVEFNGVPGANSHAIGYPTLIERGRFVRALLKLRASHQK